MHSFYYGFMVALFLQGSCTYVQSVSPEISESVLLNNLMSEQHVPEQEDTFGDFLDSLDSPEDTEGNPEDALAPEDQSYFQIPAVVEDIGMRALSVPGVLPVLLWVRQTWESIPSFYSYDENNA